MLTTDYCRQLFEHMLSIKVSVVTDLGALQACLVVVKITAIVNEKSARRRRKHWALAVVRWSQKFHPATDPFSGARDGQNLISWRWSLPLPTNPVW